MTSKSDFERIIRNLSNQMEKERERQTHDAVFFGRGVSKSYLTEPKTLEEPARIAGVSYRMVILDEFEGPNEITLTKDDYKIISENKS